MAVSLNIQDIIRQVKQLDKQDQLTLLQTLASMLKRTEVVKEDATLSSLSGLGSDLWKNPARIDSYIDEERQW